MDFMYFIQPEITVNIRESEKKNNHPNSRRLCQGKWFNLIDEFGLLYTHFIVSQSVPMWFEGLLNRHSSNIFVLC